MKFGIFVGDLIPVETVRGWIELPLRHAALALCTLALCGMTTVALAQGPVDDDATRKLWDTAYENTSSRRATKKPLRRFYRRTTPSIPTQGVASESVVGVTIWRLQPAKADGDGERIIVHEAAGSVAWTPVRVSSESRLAEGDRVRLSVEAARTGYLYVIDREQYADGTVGEPLLVFPTTRTLGGDNRVEAGRLIDLPDQGDAPPFFTLKRSRADQVGESLTIIITPTPLTEVQIMAKAQVLSPELVAQWEKTWGGPAGRLELAGTPNRAWTSAERDAARPNGQVLNAHAPAPQTLFYRPGVKPSEPFLVKLALQYGRRR